MKFIKGTNRQQTHLFPVSLEQSIAQDNEVRVTKQGKSRASADVGFMFIAYNLKRIMNILGQEVFKKYLRMLVLLFLQILSVIRLKNLKYKQGKFFRKYSLLNFASSLNRFIFDKNLIVNGGF